MASRYFSSGKRLPVDIYGDPIKVRWWKNILSISHRGHHLLDRADGDFATLRFGSAWLGLPFARDKVVAHRSVTWVAPRRIVCTPTQNEPGEVNEHAGSTQRCGT